MLKEFKAFIMRGNVVDLAVGIIIGAAFGAIVNSLVSDLLMPPIGLALGNVDFSDLLVVLKEGTVPGPYPTLAAAKAAGAVTLNYGAFITQLISFLIVAFAVFCVVKAVNRLQTRPATAPTTKDCPQCAMAIPLAAKRCPHCTQALAA